MNRGIILVSVIATQIILSGCQNKKSVENITPAVQETKKEIQKIDFLPPVDSMITENQMKNWLNCNPLLDSLTMMYSDSFKTTDAQLRMRYQADFSSAQDKICVVSGLSGGYKEYKWIMENIGNPKNRAVAEGANAAVF